MQFYPAGETIELRLLDLPEQRAEWIIAAADADEIIAAGFQRCALSETRFIHPEPGDVYRLARHRYLDEDKGRLCYRCGHAVTLQNELAARSLTILAMAADGCEIIDPFNGQDDLSAGLLRHTTPFYVHVPRNLSITAVWAARLRAWGFRVAHPVFRLMKSMVALWSAGAYPAERHRRCGYPGYGVIPSVGVLSRASPLRGPGDARSRAG